MRSPPRSPAPPTPRPVDPLDGFTVHEPARVRALLAAHPTLAPVLALARATARATLAEAPVHLRVLAGGDAPPELAARVAFGGTSAETLAAYARLLDHWLACAPPSPPVPFTLGVRRAGGVGPAKALASSRGPVETRRHGQATRPGRR